MVLKNLNKCHIVPTKFVPTMVIYKCFHLAAHREKKRRVTCELCGKSFFAKTYLDRHMLTTHTDKSERLAMREQCKYCGEWLMTKGGIYYHKQVISKKIHGKKFYATFQLTNTYNIQCTDMWFPSIFR